MVYAPNDAGHITVHNTIDTELHTAFTAYVPTLTNFPATLIEARYKQIGKLVWVYGQVNLTGAATNSMFVSLPVAAHSSPGQDVTVGLAAAQDSSAALTLTGAVILDTANARFHFKGFAGAGSGADIGPATPFTWASGDVLRFQATYEAA